MSEAINMLKITALIIFMAIAAAVFELLRRRTLREKYAFAWLFALSSLAVGAVFYDQVNRFSRFLGFEVFSNFILVFFGLMLMFVVMQMSLELGKLEDQNQTLAEEIALIKQQNTES